ncbi:MAG: ion transporter [Lachnospiraceae bacterium]|jgi:voltage-gated potassium channel|nr:ion transporter [Lachnospiraceae bacterium]MCI1328620.1 ion transporter [Lachnospiraceae bacterium]
MHQLREHIYHLVEPPGTEEKTDPYDAVMMIMIIASIIPLAFKSTNLIFLLIEKVSVVLFLFDYALRWFTADMKLRRNDAVAFIIYPFTPMAVIDLLSILPGIFAINQGFRLFRMVRLIRMFRIFRVFKAMRYSKSINMITRVLVRQKDSLIAVCYIAGGYILICALVVFNVEPQSFNTFFDAVYWATISLTTVGYGDIYPVTTVGRIMTMISAIFGVAVIAMPAGIITAGLMEELMNRNGRQ